MLRPTLFGLLSLLAALPPDVTSAEDTQRAVVVTRDLEYVRVGDKRLLRSPRIERETSGAIRIEFE